MTYSEKNVFAAVTEVSSPSTCQQGDLTTKWNECARTDFPKFVNVHRGRWELERNAA